MSKGSIGKKKFVSIDPTDLSHMKRVDAIPLLKQIRSLFKKQASTFEKNPNVYSWAYEKMAEWYKDHGEIKLRSIKRVDAVAELARLQDFFKSQSSTLSGSKKILEEQSKRIFGVDEKGKPLYKMNTEQSRSYWALYKEYESLASTGFVKNFNSNTIQSVVGEYLIENKDFRDRRQRNEVYFTGGDIREIERRLQKRKELEEWEFNETDLDNILTDEGYD